VYFIVPDRMKNLVLLLASLFFYGWGEPKYLVFMLAAVTQSYIAALLVERFRGTKIAKLAVAVSAVASLGLLAYCKYADFFIENFNALTGLSVPLLRVVLPVGISFYTFQILSYVIDVYRGDVPAQRNFIDLAMYVAMFPQLIAGPIVRYSDIVGSLKNRKTTLTDVSEGIVRFSVGLAKKILLANSAALIVAEFKTYDEKTVLFYWLYAAAYMLHIYFDFSGYSDMAIGLGRIFGFRFCENFNYPYISASITEFWRRWHISLGSWFRDYLYIPLGGNRVKPIRHVFNILVVWAATGF
jgi:predicted membrane protein involved in D-alanine export